LSTAAEMAKVLRLRIGEHDPREFNLEEFVLPMTSYSRMASDPYPATIR